MKELKLTVLAAGKLGIFAIAFLVLRSQTIQASPYILSLFATAKGENHDVCWQGTKFDEKLCKKKTNSCKLSGKFHGLKKGKLEIKNLEEFKNNHRRFNLHYYISDTNKLLDSYQVESTGTWPLGSKLKVFALNRDHAKRENTFSFLGEVEISENSSLVLSEKAHQILKIKMPEDLNAGEYFSVRILGADIHLRPTDRFLQLKITPGKYEFKISKMFNGKTLESKTFQSDVPAISQKGKVIEVSMKGFQAISDSHLDVNLTNDGLSGEFKRSQNSERYIFKLRSVSVPEIGKENLVNNFEISNGKLQLTNTGKAKLFPLNLPSNLGNIIVEAECGTVSFPDSIKHDVFADAEGKMQTGTIAITVSKNTEQLEVAFFDVNGVEKKFDSKFDQSYCGGENNRKLYLDYITSEARDGFGFLGSGPWGQSGWIRASITDLFSYSGTFQLGSMSNIVLKKSGKGKIEVSGTNIYDSPDSSEDIQATEPAKTEFQIDDEFLWNKNGEFNFSLGC